MSGRKQKNRLSVDEWEDEFQPIVNHINPNASWGGDDAGSGTMFETYGAELEFVATQPNDTIWTWVDVDGNTSIVNGYQYVNRLGYFVTKKMWDREYTITVRKN